MSDLLTHVERSLMVDVDLDLEPQCESEFHESKWNEWGFQSHGGPATHYQVTPCGHWSGLRCAPHVAAIRRSGAGYCDICKSARDVADYRFIEL